jgi:hypothetical protein
MYQTDLLGLAFAKRGDDRLASRASIDKFVSFFRIKLSREARPS